jgi:hypothetical protein
MTIQKNIVILILGGIIGILLCQLFHSTNKATLSPTLSDKKVGGEINNVEEIYSKKENLFLKANDALNQNIKSNKKQLIKIQTRNIQLQTQVADIINSKQKDTILMLKDCDSLQQKVEQLIITHNQKDSIYNEVVNDITEQSCKKDSLIIIQKEQAIFLKNTIKECIQNNNLLSSHLLAFKKENRKQSRKSKVKIGITFLAAILFANKLL